MPRFFDYAVNKREAKLSIG